MEKSQLFLEMVEIQPFCTVKIYQLNIHTCMYVNRIELSVNGILVLICFEVIRVRTRTTRITLHSSRAPHT